MSAITAEAGGIRAGSALGALGRATFNPLVQGSTPWRPTRQCIVSDLGPVDRFVDRCQWSDVPSFHGKVPSRTHRATPERFLAREGLRRDRPTDGPRDPAAEDMQDRTGSADRARQAARAGLGGTPARDERHRGRAHGPVYGGRRLGPVDPEGERVLHPAGDQARSRAPAGPQDTRAPARPALRTAEALRGSRMYRQAIHRAPERASPQPSIPPAVSLPGSRWRTRSGTRSAPRCSPRASRSPRYAR